MHILQQTMQMTASSQFHIYKDILINL